MKKLIIAAALLAATTTASVQANDLDCNAISIKANNIMVARQDGERMTTLMSKAENEGERLMIQMAYEHPRYSTLEYKQKAVDEFANEFAAACYAY